jgi:dynein heavy chain
MQNIPVEIEKNKMEMNKCFEVYKILDEFSYRFNKEDMDRRWHVFGCPRDTLELVQKRRKECDKERTKFLDEMKEA